MKILLCHSYYQKRGGEDVVFEQEHKLLLDQGAAVSTYVKDNNSIHGRKGAVSAGVALIADRSDAADFVEILRDVRPDVVHFHNMFPSMGRNLILEAQRSAVVVCTLHNFRYACANGTLLRDGRFCDQCVGRSSAPAILHGCYRGSRLASIPLALSIQARRLRRQAFTADKYICLSKYAREMAIRAGANPNKVLTRPNFLDVPPNGAVAQRREGLLYVGRLEEEKGIHILIEAAASINGTLRVAGDGAMRDMLTRIAPPNVEFLGMLSKSQVMLEMNRATAIVVPSICPENFPMTVLEAFATSTPVIASRIGSLAELVPHDQAGLLFQVGSASSLAKAANELLLNKERSAHLGHNAFELYQGKYTAHIAYESLMRIYEEAVGERRCLGSESFSVPSAPA